MRTYRLLLGSLLVTASALVACNTPGGARVCSVDTDCVTGEICIGTPALPTGVCGAGSRPDAGAEGGTADASDAQRPDARDAMPSTEAGPEAGPDATPSTEAGPEASVGPDAGPEASVGPDAGPEASVGPDAEPDVQPGPDAGPEASVGPDAGPDVQPGPDAGPESSVADDAGPEASTPPTDAAAEAGPEPTPDAATPADAAPDAASDSAPLVEAGPDASPADAGTDASPADAGPDVVVAPGDTCESPIVLMPDGMPVTSSNVSATNHYSGGTSGNQCASTAFSGSGADRVFSITLPANKIVTVVTTPDAVVDAVVNLTTSVANCATGTAAGLVCAAGADDGSAGGTETVTYANTTSGPVTVFVVVEGYGASDSGGFTISATLSDPLPVLNPGDTCDSAIAVPTTAGVQHYAGSAAGLNGDYGAGTNCSGTAGRDGVYAVDLAPGKRVTASVTGTGAFDPSISIGTRTDACTSTARVCIAGDDSGSTATTNTVRYSNSGSSAVTVFLFVDTYSSSAAGGDFLFDVTVDDVPAGDACNNAEPIVTTGAILSTTAGFTGDYGTGTTCGSTAGPDRVFRIDVPNNQQLTASVAGLDTSFDPAIAIGTLAGACTNTGRACLAGANSGGATATDTVVYSNRSGASQTLYVFVDSASASTSGGFTLTTALAAIPAMGETCALAETLPTDGSTVSGNTGGFTSDYNGGATGSNCASVSATGAGAPDRVYVVTVPPNKVLRAVVTPSNFDASVSLVNGSANCVGGGALVCVGGANASTSTTGAETATYTNATSAPETIFVIVDGNLESSSGSFTVSATLQDPPITTVPGDTCATAVPLTGTQVHVVSNTMGLANDYGAGTNCLGTAGSDGVYQVDVPPGQRVTATVYGTSTFDPSISIGLAAACTSTSRVCESSNDSGTASTLNTTSYTNGTSSTVTVFLFIDTFSSSTTTGPFDLTVTVDTPPAGDTCANAVPITVSGTTTETITSAYTNDYTAANVVCGSVAGLDRVYSVDVPAGQRVTVSVAGTATTFNPSLALGFAAGACTNTARSCIGASDVAAMSTDTLTYANYNATAQTILIFVDSGTSSATGSFTLTTAFDSVPTEVPGESCFSAEELTLVAGTATVTGTTVGYANNLSGGTGCAAAASSTTATYGLDRVYKVSVPPGEQITAVVTPQSTFNPVVDLVAGNPSVCEARPRVCRATATAAATGAAETARWINDTGAAVDVFVVVDSTTTTTAAQSGTFTLAVTVAAPPPGDTCVDAPVLPASPFSGTLTGYSSNLASSTTCRGSGLDRMYQVTVNNGQTLSVTLTPTGTAWDPVLSFIVGASGGTPSSACTVVPAVCAASSDAGGSAAAETASYTNTSGGAQTVYVIPKAYFSSVSAADFTLSYTLTP